MSIRTNNPGAVTTLSGRLGAEGSTVPFPGVFSRNEKPETAYDKVTQFIH